jgi:glycosyltransferase involved in cell wall biosynthesis
MMKILRVNTYDLGGGAEKIAWTLFDAERQAGHTSRLVVSEKRSNDADVLDVLKPPQPGALGRYLLKIMARLKPLPGAGYGAGRVNYVNLRRGFKRWAGIEIFDYPNTYRLFELTGMRPDILHCHNLHRQDGGFFDLRALPWFSAQLPLLLTLHDAWLLSGHCAHSFECQRWLSGCGHCPDLTIYPAVRRDATAHNWKVKRDIFLRSRLYIATPSRWLMDKVQRSILQPAILEGRVIHDGIDLSIFAPTLDRASVRAELGLPQDMPILLVAAGGIRSNPFKDYATLRKAFEQIAQQSESSPVLFLALGDDAPAENIAGSELRFVPFQASAGLVARYYQAADIYLHPARADTFPNTVLEALACGLPVVATRLGGIPEQVQDGFNGFLTLPGDAAGLAQQSLRLLGDAELRKAMGQRAAQNARQRFDRQRMIQEYQTWFQEMLA